MTSGICCDVQRITQPLAKTTNKGRPLFFSILEYTHEWMPINLTKDVLSSEKSMLKANEEFLIWGQIHISCISNTLLYTLSSFLASTMTLWLYEYVNIFHNMRVIIVIFNSVQIQCLLLLCPCDHESVWHHTLPPSWKVTILSSSSYISYISSSYMYFICIFVRHSKYKQE